jgi:hypothetical protein
MNFKHSKISEYTETEFLELLGRIFNAECPTEEEYDETIEHIEKITEHPSGSDILFYPEPGVDDSPEGVLKVVKEWRAANGLPGFKAG